MTPHNVKNDLGELQQKLVKQIKILEIERNLAGRRGFWKGLLAGFAGVILLFGLLGFLALRNPAATLEFAAENFLMDYMESIFAGFPDAYMTNNRDRVIQTLDDFTNAMQYNQVSRDDFRNISRQIFSTLQDRRITYQEMDAILQSLEQAAKAPEPR